MRPVWPFIRLLRCGDSHKPMASKIIGRMITTENYFDKKITEFEGGAKASPFFHQLYVDVYACKDKQAKSGGTYWEKMKSEFNQAAFALDPEFWDLKPWNQPGVLDSVIAQFTKRSGTWFKEVDGGHWESLDDTGIVDNGMTALGKAVRVFLNEFGQYQNKTGPFSRDASRFFWPTQDQNGKVHHGSLVTAHSFWQKVSGSTVYLAQFAVQQTSQVASQSMDERAFKAYKTTVTKRSTSLGRPTLDDRILGIDNTPIGCRMTLTRINQQCLKGQDAALDPEDEEIALRSFSIDDEAHFSRVFAEDIRLLPPKRFVNSVEGWESAVTKNDRTHKYKLSNKYNCIKLRDHVDGHEELRQVIRIEWVKRGREYKVNTALLHSTDETKTTRDVSTDEAYIINSALHDCILAARDDNIGVELC